MLPLLWAAYALLAAGTAANAKAQSKVKHERSKVAGEERERRKKSQLRSEELAQQSLDQYASMKDKEKQRAGELATKYTETASAPISSDAGTRYLATDAPTQATETVDAINNARTRVAAEESARGAALGKLRAFGDVFQDSNIAAAHNAQDIGREQGNVASWQQNVLPFLYEKANASGRDWATAGDVMKLVGSIMLPMGLAKSAAEKAATTAGEVASKASMAGSHDLFDPYAWQSWMKPQAAPRFSLTRPM